jgi:hypothetical protein
MSTAICDSAWLLASGPTFLVSCPQMPRGRQQGTFAHHDQPLLAPQPWGHAPIAVRQYLPRRHDDMFVTTSAGPAASRLLPRIQTRIWPRSHPTAWLCSSVSASPARGSEHHCSSHVDDVLRDFDLQRLLPQRSFQLPDAAVLFGFGRSSASPPIAASASCPASSFQLE